VSTICRGRIIYVELLDPQGRNLKRRPAVVVTATEEIVPEGEVVVVAISTQKDQTGPEMQVDLPWSRPRHPRTGLSEPCSAVCSWLATVKVSDIRDLGGVVPGRPLLEILNLLANLERKDDHPEERET
jgi:mRNA-degrading endonuclease toxin of MazEF toxin-antitoxin module